MLQFMRPPAVITWGVDKNEVKAISKHDKYSQAENSYSSVSYMRIANARANNCQRVQKVYELTLVVSRFSVAGGEKDCASSTLQN